MDYKLYKYQPKSLDNPAEAYNACEVCEMEYQFTKLVGVQRRKNGNIHPVCGLCSIIMFGDGEMLSPKKLIQLL